MADYEYEKLLERARSKIPKEISERQRWTLPEPDVLIEGNNTLIRNFTEVVSHMDRDLNHVYQFLLRELGTSGSLEAPRAQFKGRIPPKRIKQKFVGYVNSYVKCTQCNAPDTVFIKQERTTILKCQACGATRPVRM